MMMVLGKVEHRLETEVIEKAQHGITLEDTAAKLNGVGKVAFDAVLQGGMPVNFAHIGEETWSEAVRL